MDSNYRVIMSANAKRDLESIYNYVAETSADENTASNVVSSILEMVLSLDYMPDRYARVIDRRLSKKGYRRFVVKSYLVFYLVSKKSKTVRIIRIIHERRDYRRLI